MKKLFGISELESRIMLDAAAVDAITNDVFHFDAQDIDADGDTSDQPADESPVNRWDDHTTNNNDATASGSVRPVYDADAFDGRGGIRFDGSNDAFDIGNAGEINTSTFNEKSFAFVFETGSDLSGHQMIYEQGAGTRGYQLSIVDGDLYAYTWNNAEWSAGNQDKSINLGSLATNMSYQAVMVHDATGPDTWSANLNGGTFQVLNNVESQRPHGGDVNFGPGDSLNPITFTGSNGSPFNGSLGEVFSWNHALTSAEATDVFNYFDSKWFNQPPTIGTNTALDLIEDESLSITNANLETTDPNDTADELVYTLQSNVTNGTLYLAGNVLNISDTFTQADIDNGLLVYDHNGSATGSDSFDFDVTDGFDPITSQTFNFNITPATASDLFVTSNTGLTVDEGDNATISDSMLNANDTWYDTNWQYRQQITIDAANIDADLTDFTMLIDGSGFGTDFWNNVQSDGGDIVITAADGTTQLARELVGINTVAQTMELHTLIPNVSSSNDTSLYIYYGNALANESNDAANTFSNYSHVYHMDNLNAVDVIAANNGVHSSGGSITTGIMGGAHEYNDNGIVDITTINGTDIRTVSFWYNPQDRGGGNFGSVLGSNSYNDGIRHIGTDEIGVRSGGGALVVDSTATFNVNKHLVFSYDDVSGTISVFENGILQDSNDFSGWHDFDHLIAIAGDNNRAPDGMVDEVRLSAQTLSLEWAAAEYANQSDPGSFYSVSAQEDVNTPIEYEITSNVSTGTLFIDANSNNIADAGEALNVNDTFTQADIDNGLLIYLHDDSENFVDSFNFTLSNGLTTTGGQTFSISINPVSDQDPSDIALSSSNVNENSGNGTLIGELSGTDGDLPSETLSFSILNDPDNKFQINGNRLEVGGSLNHEASASHSVTIRVDDGNGGTYDEIFTINVNDINERPSSPTIDNTTIDENSSNGTIVGLLSATDPDQPGDSLSFSIINDPDNKFQISGNRLEVGGALDFETQTSHNVTVRVSDGNGGFRNQAFTINVNDVNDIPIATTGDASTAQGGVLTLTTSMLSASDEDNADAGLVFEISDLPTHGTLQLNGTDLNTGDSFSQQDIIDGNVTYTHDNAATVNNDSFDFNVSDGALTTAPLTLNIDITPSLNTINDITVDEGSSVAISNGDLAFEGAWFDQNWQYRQQITIDSTLIDADLADFSILLTEAGFGSDFWSNVNSNGSDIVITAADGTSKLDRELVSIDTTGQTMQLYTRTDLSATEDTNLFIYYGNAAASESNQATTWRSEYTGVWHFDDDFSDGDVSDSSQAGNDGFTQNGFNSGNQTTGVIGNAGDFNDSEYLALNKSFSGNNSLSEISVSGWINTTVNAGGQSENWSMIDFDRSEFFNVYIHGDGRVGFSTTASSAGTNDFYSTGVTVNDGNWYHIAAVYDGTDKILYVDGVEVARDNNSHGGDALGRGTRFGYIGQNSEGSSFNSQTSGPYYDGLYDNIRMYEGTMSAEWVAVEYRNHNNPGRLYDAGTQTQFGDHLQYTLNSAPGNGTLFVDANGNNTLDSGEELATSDTFTQADIDNGDLVYVHDGSETLSDSISFDVTSLTTGETTAPRTLNITVNPVNDVVFFDNGSTVSLTIDEDAGAIDLTSFLTANDGDFGDTLTWSIVIGPSNGSLSGFDTTAVSNGSVIDPAGLFYQSDLNYNGGESFSIRVSDGVSQDDITLNVTINPVNDAPVISTISDQSVDQDKTLGGISITISDVDSPVSSLTLSASSDNQQLLSDSNINISGSGASRTLFIPHDEDFFGVAEITLSVSDGSDASNRSFNLNVNEAGGFFIPPAGIKIGSADIGGTGNLSGEATDIDTGSDFTGGVEEEELDGETNLIRTSVQQNMSGFRENFYGRGALEEIHRDMVVRYISGLNDLSGQQVLLSSTLTQTQQEGGDNVPPAQMENEEDQEGLLLELGAQQTSQGLSALAAYYEKLNATLFAKDAQNEDVTEKPKTLTDLESPGRNVQNQFDTIQSYQKNHHNSLRAALLSGPVEKSSAIIEQTRF